MQFKANRSITLSFLLFSVVFHATSLYAQNRSGEPIPAMPKLLSQREQADVRELIAALGHNPLPEAFVAVLGDEGLEALHDGLRALTRADLAERIAAGGYVVIASSDLSPIVVGGSTPGNVNAHIVASR